MIELEKLGLDCSLIPNMSFRNFLALPTVNFIKSINADLFVSSNPYYGLLGASLAKKMGNLKYSVFRLKGDYWTESKFRGRKIKYKIGGYVKMLENFLAIKDVDFILAISDWIKQKAEYKGLHNIYTLYNGVDCFRFRPREKDPKYRTQLLCVMNFNIYQKIVKIYNFLNEYKKRGLSYHIKLLGNGLYLNNLKKHTYNMGLDKLVTFKGWVNDIEYYYSNCDVLIHPSGLDAFGMAPLEAGASAKSVVATKVGGIPEIVIDGKTGFLTNDLNLFLDYIEKLMEDYELRRKIGLNARRLIVDKFTWKNSAKRFYDILKIEGIITEEDVIE